VGWDRPDCHLPTTHALLRLAWLRSNTVLTTARVSAARTVHARLANIGRKAVDRDMGFVLALGHQLSGVVSDHGRQPEGSVQTHTEREHGPAFSVPRSVGRRESSPPTHSV
jgi:hypothetical protein